jgi:hypothetical protein
MKLLRLIAPVALLAACGPSSNTLFIEVCGDVQIPADIDAVRISVLEADRTEHRTGTLDLLNCGGESLALPQTTEIEAPFGDVWVVVQGLQDGLEVMSSERRLNIEEKGPAQDVLVGLTRSCMRIACTLGQTCIDGVCEQAPWESDDGACSGGPPSDGAGGSTAMCAAEAP